MEIKIFGKKGCAKCETTKNKLEHLIQKCNYNNVFLNFFDMDTIEGVAEGAYYDVLKIPTTVIEKEDATAVRWEGQIPKTEDVKKHCEGVLEPV